MGAEADIIWMQSLIKILSTSNVEVNRCLKLKEQTAKFIPEYEYLSSVPGIGVVTGATILSEIGDIAFF